MKELLSENFSQIRSILQEVESITHFTDDENMLKSRHPDWQVGLNINDLKERDKQLKQTFEAYLKTLNTTAKDFKNDEKTRNKLLTAFSTLKDKFRLTGSRGVAGSYKLPVKLSLRAQIMRTESMRKQKFFIVLLSFALISIYASESFSAVKVISVLLPLMLLNGLFTSEFSSGLCQVQAWLRSFLN